MTLTVKRIERLKEKGRYADGHGLYLQVNEGGAKSWIFRWQRGVKPDGKPQEFCMGLGPLHTVTLDEAREAARAARKQLLDGGDPLAAKKERHAAQAAAAAKVLTFKEAAEAFYEQHKRKWKNAKHSAQFLSTLAMYAFPKIGKLSVAAIDTGAVLKCVEPIWQSKTETASRVRGRIESVLDWATVRGYRSGDNPARWRGHLDNVLPARAQIAAAVHHAALPWAEIPAFMAALASRQGVAAKALEFTILTAARTGEVIGAQWSEFDLNKALWIVPAERMKAKREHRVPLSDRAIALLRGLPHERGNDFVFIGPTKARTAISNMAMAVLLKRMDQNEITVHGFRSCFRDWAAERTGYANHIVEMALAHTVGDKVEAAYRRGDLLDKRARLMTEWSAYCYSPPAHDAQVLSLRRGVE